MPTTREDNIPPICYWLLGMFMAYNGIRSLLAYPPDISASLQAIGTALVNLSQITGVVILFAATWLLIFHGTTKDDPSNPIADGNEGGWAALMLLFCTLGAIPITIIPAAIFKTYHIYHLFTMAGTVGAVAWLITIHNTIRNETQQTP